MSNICYFVDFRIGTSVANLIRLNERGISNPVDWTYLPYAVTRLRGDLRSVGDGFPSVSWMFERMSQEALNRILAFFSSDTDASVSVYIRTPTERGPKTIERDFSAVMHRPTFAEGKSAIPQSGYPVWSNVTIRFTGLVAQ